MILLDQKGITLKEWEEVVFNFEKIEIEKNLLNKIAEQRKKIEKIIDSDTFYGINTGFGENAFIKINGESIDIIQKNIVISHSAGVGDCMNPYIVRGIILLRLNSLLNPHSCVRVELIDALTKLLNSKIVPSVKKFGSVGASGDLSPLSDIACFISGNYHKDEVFVFDNNRWNKVSFNEVKKKIPYVELRAKEGLALINGTQATTSIGIHNLLNVKDLIDLSNIALALTVEVMRSKDSPFDTRLLSLKKHQGPLLIGKHIKKIIKGSRRINTTDRVQDPYSIRCYPQVIGAIVDNIRWVEEILLDEANSISDNPIMVGDQIISGGNFHAEPVGFALELLNMSTVEIGNISDRRSFLLLNPAKNKLFNPFLAEIPGEMNGMMIAQYTTASLANYNKTLSMPSIIDTIPTSADQEDHVSMAYNSALRGEYIIQNVKYILSIEILISLQALKFFKGEGLGVVTSEVFSFLDNKIPFYRDHIQLNVLIERIREIIEEYNFKSLIPSLWKM